MLSNFIQASNVTGTSTRIVFQASTTKAFLKSEFVLQDLEVNFPENFVALIKSGANLFIYYSANGPRLGFIAKIEDEAKLKTLMAEWESTLAKDLSLVTKLLNRSINPVTFVAVFKQNTVKNIEFRYLDSLVADMGICYGFVKDYFILTTSGENMISLINVLNQ